MKTKKLIADLICLPFVGRFVSFAFGNSIPNVRTRGFSFYLKNKAISYTNRAKIFWGIYEHGEILTIKKYLKRGYDIVELGSSIGVVSSYLGRKIQNDRILICVEANPSLIDLLKKNLIKNTQSPNFKILNLALSYTKKNVPFRVSLSNNTGSHVVTNEIHLNETIEEIVNLPTIQLNQILNNFNLKEYILISDIEGAELEILLYDKKSLLQCKQIIAELHVIEYNNKLYTPSDMQVILENFGFQLQSKHGNIYNFIKN